MGKILRGFFIEPRERLYSTSGGTFKRYFWSRSGKEGENWGYAEGFTAEDALKEARKQLRQFR